MSIYTKYANEFLRDFDVTVQGKHEPKRQPAAVPPTAIHAAPRQAQNWQRMGEPASVVLPPTRHWLIGLPASVRPQALVARFPRIANVIAADWSEPRVLRAYFDDLLIENRRDREGFPIDVLRELLALRAFFADLHPDAIAAWDGVRPAT